MNIFIVCFIVMVIAFVFVRGLRGTIFEVSLKRRNLGGILIGKEIFAFIIMGVLLFEIFGYKAFYTFYVTGTSMHEATYFTLYAVLLLLLSISFFSKHLFGHYLRTFRDADSSDGSLGKERVFLKISAALLIFVLAAMHLAGMQNAFLHAVATGQSLMAMRLENTYGTDMPSVVTSYYTFLTIFTSVCVGINYSKMSWPARTFYFLLILYAASFHGGKAPVMNSFLMILLGNLSERKQLSMGRGVWLLIIGVPLVLVIFYFVSLVQFPDLTLSGYVTFLAARLGVGQIQGVYEQFGLQIRNTDYIFQAIPFANFVTDSTHFNKDLMMATWGSGHDLDSTGVMNSFFIGEALAIGGYTLVLISPVIVAFNYCTIAVSLLIMFRKFFGLSISRAQRYVILLIPGLVRFTADLDGVLLFKLNVMLVLFFGTITLSYRLLRTRRIRRDAAR